MTPRMSLRSNRALCPEYSSVQKQAVPRLLGYAPEPLVHNWSWQVAWRYSRRSTSGRITTTLPRMSSW